jgi:hypothetical protein
MANVKSVTALEKILTLILRSPFVGFVTEMEFAQVVAEPEKGIGQLLISMAALSAGDGLK